MIEIRDILFSEKKNELFCFELKSKEPAVIAGLEKTQELLSNLNIKVSFLIRDLSFIEAKKCILRGFAKPIEIVNLEEKILGIIGKISGISTAAWSFLKASNGNIKVVCGAWKKINPEIKDFTRRIIEKIGLPTRITNPPFIYIDKNYLRMIGGIEKAIKLAKTINNHTIVVQLHNIFGSVKEETLIACEAGAHILMVDTGDMKDIADVISIVRKLETRPKVAFSGGVTIEQIPDLIEMGVDIVDVGRAIIDAPMIDLTFDVCS
ncbi:MAG: nicotinate-nucleotide pyrophosphorylase [Caldisphaera sp.]|uniref:nicotinate-nucleotide pyrophosphorylase n=1 Tax=Caldisphaera sp. TaxID=2060322 RepID=UPI003D11630D